jgi:hypothetical protein
MEDLLRDYIRTELVLNHQLNEGAVTDAIANQALQWLVGAAAEYGLGGITLPAAGAGVVVGPAVETVSDTIFAVEGVAAAVMAVGKIGDELGDFSETFKKALAAYSGSDWDGYYDSLKAMTQQGVGLMGKQAEKGIEEIAEMVTDALKKMVQKLVGALNKGIKVVIPDATIGAATAATIESIVMAAAENAYSLLTAAIEEVEILSDFVEKPGEAVKFFESILQQLVDMINRLVIKIRNASITDKAKALVVFGPVGGTLVLKLGDDGFEEIAQTIERQTPVVLDVIEKTLTVLVPAAITAVAFLQILLSGDYKPESEEGEIEESLRRLIRGELQSIIAS